MADGAAQTVTATFPNPPPFWEAFTPENIEKIRAQGADGRALELDTSLETTKANDLIFLTPPSLPRDEKYRCFGDQYSLNQPLPSLEAQGVSQVYTPPSSPPIPGLASGSQHTDRALILKRLAKSLLLNFLELVGTLGTNPEQHVDKVQDIRTLFINFHHLLNEYRPHQARESLLNMMERQLERSRMETSMIRTTLQEVSLLMETFRSGDDEGALDKVEALQAGPKTKIDQDAAMLQILEMKYGSAAKPALDPS